MILLRRDCLVFETSNGESIPCSATEISVELMGAAADSLDKEIIEHAAMGVLHFFKEQLGRSSVSVAEFSVALEQALNSLGLNIKPKPAQTVLPRVTESDLSRLAYQSGQGYELLFFGSLREELRRNLELSPSLLRFRCLRLCVKRLIGAKRWSRRCQTLNDQIVTYLRTCLRADPRGMNCALVIS